MQIDGSEHAWFEDRGPPCTLLAFVDNATSRLMPAMIPPSGSINAGFVKPNSLILPAIWATWASECVLALRA